jgi:hypothetical protein
MDDLRVPSYYVVSRKMPKDQIGPILNALSITPVYCSIVSDIHDAELALSFASHVLRCKTEGDSCVVALAVSAEHKLPVLVVGTADVLDAVYSDGRRHPVAATA